MSVRDQDRNNPSEQKAFWIASGEHDAYQDTLFADTRNMIKLYLTSYLPVANSSRIQLQAANRKATSEGQNLNLL